MKKLNIKEIEEIIHRFRSSIELENYFKKELEMIPCLIIKKTEKSEQAQYLLTRKLII